MERPDDMKQRKSFEQRIKPRAYEMSLKMQTVDRILGELQVIIDLNKVTPKNKNQISNILADLSKASKDVNDFILIDLLQIKR